MNEQQRKAMELALEALESCYSTGGTGNDFLYQYYDDDLVTTAITAIKEALAQPERDYERGFIDGMQKQMQSSVDKAVNAMPQRTWASLTNEERAECWETIPELAMRKVEAKLKEKNT